MVVAIDRSTVVISGRGAGNLSEISQRLINGETLFMSKTEAENNINRPTIARRGLRVRRAAHVLDGIKGVAVWAEPRA